VRELTRHYDTLTANERFRLFIEAARRKDIQELDRLNDTCPRKKYICEDWDYTHRKVRFFDLALLHANEVANIDCIAFATLALLLPHEDDLEAEETISKLKEALVKLTVKRLSMTEGWNCFCRDLGLSPDRIAFPYLASGERDWLMDIIDHTLATVIDMALDPDESQVRAHQAQWRECWGGMDHFGKL
jgi:hypothetical protein